MINAGRRNFSKVYKNYINGSWVDSRGTQKFDIKCPLTQDLIGQVPMSTESEFNEAVANAKETFKTWRNVSTPQKVRMMLKY